MVSVPESLLEPVRACLANGGPEIWRSPDGGRRVLGPLNSAYSFLYVMAFEGPEAEARLIAYERPPLDSIIEPDFSVIANLSAELGRPALLVEPLLPRAA